MTAVSAKSGDILWRKIFEKNERGDIKLLYVQAEASDTDRLNFDNEIITVSGSSPALIRGWNPITGNIQWEWSLTPNSAVNAEHSLWFYDNLYVYHVIPVYGSHIEVTPYFATSGQQIKATTSKIMASFINENSCTLVAPYFVCAMKHKIIGIHLTAEKVELVTKNLDKSAEGKPISPLRVCVPTTDMINDLHVYVYLFYFC